MIWNLSNFHLKPPTWRVPSWNHLITSPIRPVPEPTWSHWEANIDTWSPQEMWGKHPTDPKKWRARTTKGLWYYEVWLNKNCQQKGYLRIWPLYTSIDVLDRSRNSQLLICLSPTIRQIFPLRREGLVIFQQVDDIAPEQEPHVSRR